MRYLIPFVLVLTLASPAATAAEDLDSAARKGNVTLIRQLVGGGADVNQRFNVGRTPLMLAAKAGQIQAVQTLIELGADLGAQDNNGDTALHLAATYEELAVVKYLLANGANIWITNRAGRNVASQAQVFSVTRPANRNLREIADYLSDVQSATPAPPPPPPPAPKPQPEPITDPGEPANDGRLVVIDVSQHQFTPERFKSLAGTALQKRGWTIIATESERVVGRLLKQEQEYRAEIRLRAPYIQFNYIRGYEQKSIGWLENLRKDLQQLLRDS